MSYLVINDVSVKYGEISAVRHVTIEVHEGESVALIGPNGAGKTSLLKAISGVAPLSAGSIALAGSPLSGRSPEMIAREGVALVPEGRRIFGTLTVRENLLTGLTSRGITRRAAKVELEAVLDLFPVLRERLGDWAAGLSGGQQQQLALARALLARPRLLMLDEPSLGLAPQVVDEVFAFLGQLRDERNTILLVEQNAIRAVEFAERVYILQRGRVVHEAAANDLTTKMTELGDLYMRGNVDAPF